MRKIRFGEEQITLAPHLPMFLELEREFGCGIRRAYETQDGWSRGTLLKTPELEAELMALREQELGYRDRYEISGRPAGGRWRPGRRGSVLFAVGGSPLPAKGYPALGRERMEKQTKRIDPQTRVGARGTWPRPTYDL